MEKLKNLIYDKSDILVTLLIIAIAAVIIWFGINNIMEPYTAKADTPTTQEDNSSDTSEATPAAVTTGAGTAADPKAATGSGITPDSNAANPAATNSAKITVKSGETSDDIGEKLMAAGAISDKGVFVAKLGELGLESKIQLGTFNIPVGSSIEDVCKIITKTN